jgi:hypothetical protein
VDSPFTLYPVEAFSIAQSSVAGALTALVLYRPLRPLVASAVFLGAVWLTALFPDAAEFLVTLGILHDPPPLVSVLGYAAFLATAAMVLARPHWVGVIAFAGEWALHRLCSWVTGGDEGLSVLHLIWFGALLGIHQLLAERERARSLPRPGWKLEPRGYLAQDLGLAALAVTLASVVATYVLSRECGSADEWAYTWQASLFAKLHAYARPPHCDSAFQTFWIFTSGGRTFSQYPPGWPLFMTPFFALGVVWLAGPFSFGLLVVAVARLARRAAAGASGSADVVAVAGPIAAVAMMASSTVLINAASRYSHIFSCACFAWSVESLATLGDRERGADAARRRVLSGVVLGIAASWLLASRAGDGATLGVGLFLYFVIVAARGRLEWRPVAVATLAFVLWGGVSLVILRLQLGKWFTTGYSLAHDYYDWVNMKFSWPKPSEVRWSVPIGTGSYCWWPLSPALGMAGLIAALRPKGRPVAFMLVVGTFCLMTLNFFLEFGRGWDFGYGPRYFLPTTVAMAVGTGVAIAPLWATARRRMHARWALLAGGPALLAVAVALVGAVRIAPLVYPNTYADTRARSAVNEAVRRDGVTNAIVWIAPRLTVSDSRDLTQNLPLEFYPADAILVLDKGPESRKCVTSAFPGRKQYWAERVSLEDIRLVPQ